MQACMLWSSYVLREVWHVLLIPWISLIRPNFAEIWICACKHIGCMHPSLHARGEVYAQKGQACFPDSIDTLISLIRPNLAEQWACACKHIGCKHASLRTRVEVCAQRGLACSPDSIGVLISLIRTHLAEIWACACKHSVHAR